MTSDSMIDPSPPSGAGAYEGSDASAPVPFVCVRCTEVYRVNADQLHAPSVLCPRCGNRRETSILRALLPRRLFARPRVAS